MKKIRIQIMVNRDEAIKAGSNVYGEHVYEPTAAEMESLTPEERLELTQLTTYSQVQGGDALGLHEVREGWGGRTERFYASKPTWDEVRRLLRLFAEKRREIRAENAAKDEAEAEKKRIEKEEELRKYAAAIDRILTDPRAAVLRTIQETNNWRRDSETFRGFDRVEGLWAPGYDDAPGGDRAIEAFERALAEVRAQQAAAKAEAEARAEAEKAARKAAIRAFLVQHATPEEVEMFDEGVLAESRIRDLARDVVFAGLASFDRYERIERSDFEHDPECGNPSLDFNTFEGGELSLEAYRKLKALRAAAPEGAEVEVRRHVGKCEDEDCSARIERFGVLVTVPDWNGHKLSREYAL